MAIVTILGAGYMGSALTFPAADNGHEVRLWGTWLDDALIRAVRAGKEHPRLGAHLPVNVRTFFSTDLAEAIAMADLVINGVTSEGIVPVMQRAIPSGRKTRSLPPSVKDSGLIHKAASPDCRRLSRRSRHQIFAICM